MRAGAITDVDGKSGETLAFFDPGIPVDVDAVIAKGDLDGSSGLELDGADVSVRFVWQGDSNAVLYERAGVKGALTVLASGSNLSSDTAPHRFHLHIVAQNDRRLQLTAAIEGRAPLLATTTTAFGLAPARILIYTGGSDGRVYRYTVASP